MSTRDGRTPSYAKDYLIHGAKCRVFDHDGELWAVDEDESFSVVIAVSLPAHAICERPADFVRVLGECPPASASAPLVPLRGPDRFEVAGVMLDVVPVILVGMLHPHATWRATAYWEPAYALLDGKVRAMVSPIMPPAKGRS